MTNRSRILAALGVTGVLACVFAAASGLAAPSKPAAPAVSADPAAWSPSVDGVRGRLIVTAAADTAKRAQLRVELELENTSDVGNPIPISWGGSGSMLDFTLEDEAGKPLPKGALGGNEMSVAYTLMLPHASTLRMTITAAAYEYVSPGRTMLRPVSFQGWDLPAKPGKLFLRAKFSPAPTTDVVPRAWKSSLALPRVELD